MNKTSVNNKTKQNGWRPVLCGAVMLLALGSAVSGCSTIEGAGKDIEKAGEAIRDAARNASD